MRKRIVLYLLLVLVVMIGSNSVASADEVRYEINEENFPDANVRKSLMNYCDSNRDGVLDANECENVYTFDVRNEEAGEHNNLSGIQNISNLQSIALYNFDLDALDFSYGKNLRTISLIDCYSSGGAFWNSLDEEKITSIIVKNQGKHTTGIDWNRFCNLQYFYYGDQSLTGVDISGLKQLQVFNCHNSSLESIDVSCNEQLRILKLQNNHISELKLGKLSQLEMIDCSSNSIATIDLRNCKNLQKVNCSSNSIKKIDTSKLPKLNTLICQRTSVKKFDFRKNKKLTNLLIGNNLANKISFPKTMTKLGLLAVEKNRCKKIDLRKNKLGKNLVYRGLGIRLKSSKKCKVKEIKLDYYESIDRLFEREFSYTYKPEGAYARYEW